MASVAITEVGSKKRSKLEETYIDPCGDAKFEVLSDIPLEMTSRQLKEFLDRRAI